MRRDLVVDAHVHFWDPALLRYPWLDGIAELRRPFYPDDYGPLRSGDVDAVVFVQADCDPDQSLAEVAFAGRLAEREPRIAGIVAFVDLLDEERRGARLDELTRSSLIVGVRHNIQGHPLGYCLDPRFVRGVNDVGARGLPFDLCITASQLPDVTELAVQCPGVRLILDHCGKPAIRDEQFAPWADDLAELARRSNVSCKLSGLLTEARSDQRTEGAIRRYATHAVSSFGPSRMLYGTDWPVATLGGGAEHWRSIVDAITVGWSMPEREAFYATNAVATYGLRLDAD